MKISIEKQGVAIGIGAALFFVLMKFLAIPAPVPNTTIQPAYAFLAFIAYVFGPVVGFLVGFIGHTIFDATTYGSPWFSWIFATASYGLIIGLTRNIIDIKSFDTKAIIKFSIAIIIACIVAWGLIAPTLDILLYKEPANKVYIQGLVAGSFNGLISIILGNILIVAYAKRTVKDGSLIKE